MIAATMLSLTLIGALIALAAWAVERACIRLALPRRFTWLVAMVAMGAAPLLPDGVLTRVPVPPAPTSSAVSTAAPQTALRAIPTTQPPDSWPPYGATIAMFGTLPVGLLLGAANAIANSATALRPLDTALLTLWGSASLLLSILTWHASHRLQRAQRRWTLQHRGGLVTPAVYVSDDIGPAAFGASRGDIVIPRWVLSLPPLERRLLLLHERSHVEARDPRLLAIGMGLVILLPWHVPLRWAYRRLQRAIEHDCDRRVLHRPQLARRYAELLLHVAERGVAARGWSQRALSCLGGPDVTMTSLLGGGAALEARLRSLVAAPITPRARLDAAAGLSLGAMLTLAACTVPIPQHLTPAPLPRFARFASLGLLERDLSWLRGGGGSDVARSVSDSLYFARNDSLVIDAIESTQPALLRLARTETPYVAVALTPENEVIAHSIRAGAPPAEARDTTAAAHRFAAAAAEAGLPLTPFTEAMFKGKLTFAADSPETFVQSMGVSHLRVGGNPLTVLWVRFKQRGSH